MITVSLVWGVFPYPRLRQRLPAIHLITRSWWWMLAILCSCYVIAKISVNEQHHYHQHPYQWVLVAFFMLIGLRGCYEIRRLKHPKRRACLIYKLQTRGIQPDNYLSIPNSSNFNLSKLNLSKLNPSKINSSKSSLSPQPIASIAANTQLSSLDVVVNLAVLTLTISLIARQKLTWQRGEYRVLLFVLFASQFNNIAPYLCGRLFGNKLFKGVLASLLAQTRVLKALYLVVYSQLC